MRPQRNAGEYSESFNEAAPGEAGFNEAPAKCRGIPRQFLALFFPPLCFNEAPAKCRGIPGRARARGPCGSGFNEAPAKCRGIPASRARRPG